MHQNGLQSLIFEKKTKSLTRNLYNNVGIVDPKTSLSLRWDIAYIEKKKKKKINTLSKQFQNLIDNSYRGEIDKNKALTKAKLVSTENLLAEEHKRHSHGIFNVNSGMVLPLEFDTPHSYIPSV